MSKLSNLLNYVLYLLLAVTLVFAGLFFFGGEIEGEAYYTPSYTEAMLNWAKLLVYITAGIALIFEIINIIIHPKSAVRTLISLGIIVLIVLVAYSLSDTTPMKIIGYNGPDNVPSMLSMAGTMLYTTYILFGITVVAILYAELSRMFK